MLGLFVKQSKNNQVYLWLKWTVLYRSFCRVERSLGLALVDTEGSPDVNLGPNVT